jgi:parallel beta-helix repeat protein
MKFILKASLILTLLFLTALYSFAATYYVDATNGNNANNGSESSPWKTLAYAVTRISGGDAINVTGTFTETVDLNAAHAGTSGSPTTFKAWSGKSVPVFDGLSGNAFNVNAGADYVTIDGFTIKNSGGVAIGANNVTLSNSTLSNITNNGIYAAGTLTNLNILNNRISSTAALGMSLFMGSATISGNTVDNIGGAWAILVGDSSNSGNVTLTNNIIYSNPNGVALANNDDTSIKNYTVTNNTFHNMVNITFSIDTNATGTHVVKNNIFYNPTTAANRTLLNFPTNTSNITSDYNNLYNPIGIIGRWGSSTNITTLSEWQSVTGQDAHAISRDPLFTSTTSGSEDFTLQSYSSSINAGDPASTYSTEPEPNGDRINQGHLGGTSSATATPLNWYVDATSGSDTTGTGSTTAPYATITKALTRFGAGEGMTVHATSGSSNTAFTSAVTITGANAGTYTSPTIIQRWSGQNAPLFSSLTAPSGAITISSVGNIIVDGFNITGSSNNGIQIDNGSDYIIIRNSRIYSNSGNGIYTGADVAHWTFDSNTIYSNTAHGLSFSGNTTSFSGNITGNMIYGNQGVAQLGIYNNSTSSGNVTISNNIIYSARVNAINIGGTTNNVNFSIANNTVYTASNAALNFAYTTDNATHTVKNNIFYANGARVYEIFQATINRVSLNYNNLYNPSGQIGQWGTSGAENTYSTLSSWQTATGKDTNSISADPLFTSVVSGSENLIPQSGSPTIDAGDPTSSYSNEPSPNGGIINQGAHGGIATATTSQKTNIYVSASSGNDGTGNGTSSTPYATFAKALIYVGAGTTVHAAGTFTEQINLTSSHSGTSSAKVTLQAWADKSAPEINASSTDYGIYINGANYTTISGITVKSAKSNGIYLLNASNVSLTSATIHSSASHGIYADSSNNSTVNSSKVYSNTGAGIYLKNSSSGNISSNTVYNNASSPGIQANESSGATITNNTIFDIAYSALRFDATGDLSATVKNNLIYVPGGGHLGYEINAGSINNFTSIYNDIYVADDTSNFGYFKNTYKTLSAWQTAISKDNNSTSNDPYFYDRNNSDITIGNSILLKGGENGIHIGAVPTSYTPAEFYVSENGSDANDGSSASPFKTIGYAISKVKSTGVNIINVLNGKFKEDLNITKRIILKGADKENTILEGKIDIGDGGSETEISGFTIKSPEGYEYGIKAEGINKTLEYIKFSNNIIENIKNKGIIFKKIKYGNIKKNKIKFKTKGISTSGASNNVTIEGNEVEDAEKNDNEGTAIEITESASKININDNGIVNSTNGINADSTSTQVTSSNNDFKDTGTTHSGQVVKGNGDISYSGSSSSDAPKIRKLAFIQDDGEVNLQGFGFSGRKIKLKIKALNNLNEAVNVSDTVLINLSSSLGTGLFYDENENKVSSISIQKGSSSKDFHYTNSSASKVTDIVTASESPDQGWQDATLSMNVLQSESTATTKQILNYPNPFNPDKGDPVKIQYELDTDKNVSVNIYDLTMNLLWKRDFAAGTEGGRSDKKNEINWDGKTNFGDVCANGVYLIMVIDPDGKKLLAKGKIAVLK